MTSSLARADEPVTSPAPAASMPARADLVRPGCTPTAFDEAAFTALLRIELATDGVTDLRVRPATASQGDSETPAGEATLAVLALEDACNPEGTLAIVIDDAATSKRVRRVVDLGAVPIAGRSRVLALAVVELLRASWAELILPDVPPPRAAVPPQVRKATTERFQRATGRATERAVAPEESPVRERVFMIAAPEARFFVRDRMGLAGIRLGPSIPLGGRSPFRLRVHASSAYGTGRAGDDSFDAWLVTSGIGVTGGGSWRRAALEFGPSVDLGWGWRRWQRGGGERSDGDGVIASVSILASGRAHLTGAWWTIADVEVGQAAGSDDGVIRTGGSTVVARLGVALAP